jgi:hypothetical protein
VLLTSALGLFAGLFVIPVPYAQYCLTFLPLFSILAATYLVGLVRTLADPVRPRRAPTVYPTAVFVLVAAATLASGRPTVVAVWVYPSVVVMAAATTILLARRARVAAALACLLITLAILPAQWTRWMADMGDDGQFAQLRFVAEQTTPDDEVLDGWSGLGVFRRHALYYWMLHPGVRAALGPDAAADLARAIISERVRPSIVILDENVRSLSPDVGPFVESRYRRVSGDLFVRRNR